MQTIVFDLGKLREARRAVGLSQREAAHRVGIVRASLQNAESGRHTPNAVALARLAALYGVSIDSLFTTHQGDGNPSPKDVPETNPAPAASLARSTAGA